MKKIRIILITFLTISSFALGQSFSVSANKTEISHNERLQVDFTFTCKDINNVGKYKFPYFEGFNILSGPNTSQQMKIINNSVSASVTYSFILYPAKVGTFTIAKASIEYGGKKYYTKPLQIKVIKGTAKAQSGNKTTNNTNLDKNVFILAIPNKTNVIKGEQLIITYKLFTRMNISSPQISKLPSYSGFWTEDLNISSNINFNYEMYKGQRYNSAVIKKVALFPTKTGKLTISPFELKIPVIVKKKKNNNDIFDDFFSDSFFGRTETIEHLAKSNSIVVNVSPLPPNAPEAFNGAVGDYNFSSSIDKTNVKTNESVNIKIRISGEGNIKLLDLPELKIPNGIEKYDPKKSEQINRNNSISGTKSIEYLIVPRIAGKKDIAPIEFCYYNPKQNKYIVKKSENFILDIKQSDSLYDATKSSFAKEDVKFLNQDIRFIKTSDLKLKRISKDKLISTWFPFAIIVPIIVLIFSLAYKKRQDKLMGNVSLVKFKNAEKVAKNKLKKAGKLLSENKSVKFYSEISFALSGYLEDKLTISKSEFTLDRALISLEERNVNKNIIEDVKNIIEKCEFIRFAPESTNMERAKELYQKTIKTIVELENSISTKND